MKIRLAKKRLERGSIVDGEGIRAVLWTQGCHHNCKGCHNPETHAFDAGYLVDVEEIKKEMDSLDIEDGITLTGGDPLFQLDATKEIAKYAKEKGLNVWCYTGFVFEDLIQNDKYVDLLKNIDVLVDGKFVLEEKSLNIIFRGSKNQRILDVKKSLNQKRAVQIAKYKIKNTTRVKEKVSSYMFI